MGKREINKILVRDRLLEEALTLFSTKGFEETTVADIVSASGIGRGTFYNYFPDVKAIFSAVVDKLNEENEVARSEARKNAKGIYQVLYASFKSYFDSVSKNKTLRDFHLKNLPHIRNVAYRSKTLQQIMSELEHDLKSQPLTGEFTDDYEFQLLSFILVGTPAELFLNILSQNIQISNEDLATFLAKMFTKVLKD